LTGSGTHAVVAPGIRNFGWFFGHLSLDGQEVELGTDPLIADTDGDG
jgi:hypothetical protein